MATPDGYLASVELWPTNWAPRGYAQCNGALLSISAYSALFSLLGTTFGGDGRTTFGLPDMRDRVPMGMGDSNRLGQFGGTSNISLNVNQFPQHSHTATGSLKPGAMTGKGTYSNDPTNNYAGNPQAPTNIYGPTRNTEMAESVVTVNIAPAGNSQPISILPPYLSLNFIIALVGQFPSRN